MELINECPSVDAAIVRSATDDPERCVGVVVAKTIVSVDGSTPGPSPPRRHLAVPYYEGPSDLVFHKHALDVYVEGNLRCAAPTTSLRLDVQVGSSRPRGLLVFGDRTWSGGRPSAPRPFTQLPMTWRRAFGGLATLGGWPLPHPTNPTGAGYVLDASLAEGRALPNYEDPEALLETPSHEPDPLCLAARPTLVGQPSELGPDDVAVQVAPGPFRFTIPSTSEVVSLRSSVPLLIGDHRSNAARTRVALSIPHAPSVEVWLSGERGLRRTTLPMRCDTVGFHLDEGLATFVYRARFTYSVLTGERRIARVHTESGRVES